jgi:hypothetical protein
MSASISPPDGEIRQNIFGFFGGRAQAPLLLAGGEAFSCQMKKCAMLFLAAALSAAAAELPVKISVLDNAVLCVRASRVTDQFSEQLRAARPTNVLFGTILDLRSADGDRNLTTNEFPNRKPPLVILVNGQTRGAASALAAQLRASGPAVVIGSTDTAPTIRPDITVAVSAADEQKFLEDPYFTAPVPVQLSTTNDLLPFVDHMSEADLVRRKIKDGEGAPGAAPLPRPEPPPVIRDPALARAVDLLKALAVLHPARG